jgi:hypothetical protein
MRLVFLLVFLSVPLFGQQAQSPAKDAHTSPDTIAFAEVVKQVTSALDAYKSSVGASADALPALSSAEFDFKTVTKSSEGLSLQILIFKIGGSHEKDATNEVIFTYKPKFVPVAPVVSPPKGLHPPPPSLKDQLLQIITGAAKSIQDAGPVADLPLSQVKVNIGFAVTWDGNGGVGGTYSIVTAGRQEILTKIPFSRSNLSSANNGRRPPRNQQLEVAGLAVPLYADDSLVRGLRGQPSVDGVLGIMRRWPP